MAALRKKYQGRADIAPSKDAPVASEPPARTSLPPIDKSPPPEDILSAESEPVEKAAQSAIQNRLAELERAESVAQEPQHPQFANEPQEQQLSPLEQVLATVPEGARGWLRAHPEYLGDPEQTARLQYSHLVAARETGDEEFGPRYYERLEHHLGLRPQRQPQQQPRPASRPAAQRQTSVSAPPTRDSVSLSTGRPTSRVQLTGEERSSLPCWG
jgi:hypothetical protein